MGSKAASFSLIFACTSTSTPVYVSPSRTKETTAFRRYERRGCRRCERTGVVRALNERKTERETTKFQRLSIALFRKQRRRAYFDFGVRLKLYVIRNERRRDHRIFLLFLPPNTSVSFPSTCMCMRILCVGVRESGQPRGKLGEDRASTAITAITAAEKHKRT